MTSLGIRKNRQRSCNSASAGCFSRGSVGKQPKKGCFISADHFQSCSLHMSHRLSDCFNLCAPKVLMEWRPDEDSSYCCLLSQDSHLQRLSQSLFMVVLSSFDRMTGDFLWDLMGLNGIYVMGLFHGSSWDCLWDLMGCFMGFNWI